MSSFLSFCILILNEWYGDYMKEKVPCKEEFCNFEDAKYIDDNYYKAYEKRYKQVYKHNYLWSSKDSSPDVIEVIENNGVSQGSKILELGCGEGRDAIFLLNKKYDVTAVDYSNTVIEKCKELSNYKYNDNFLQFDIINDELNEKFDFIYSIAVIHMFVNKEHRNKFYNFIYNHLKPNGIALIASMGDGKKIYETDIQKSFDDVERVVVNNEKKIKIATTSCKIVDWKTFEKELADNNLVIKKKWISTKIPEFNPAMCVIVCRKEK